MALFQQGLRIPSVDVRWRALGKNMNHALRFYRKVRLFRSQRRQVLLRVGSRAGQEIHALERSQTHGSKAHSGPLEHLSAGHEQILNLRGVIVDVLLRGFHMRYCSLYSGS